MVVATGPAMKLAASMTRKPASRSGVVTPVSRRGGGAARRSPSQAEEREALGGVEDVRLDEVDLGRPSPQLRHGAHQTHPVQHLLLAGVLDRRQRRASPGLIVGGAELLVER